MGRWKVFSPFIVGRHAEASQQPRADAADDEEDDDDNDEDAQDDHDNA